MYFASKKAYMPRRKHSIEKIDLPSPESSPRSLGSDQEASSPQILNEKALKNLAIQKEEIEEIEEKEVKEVNLRRCSSEEALSVCEMDLNRSWGDHSDIDLNEEAKVVENPKEAKAFSENRRYKEKVDANIVCIPLGLLKDISVFATGDPVFCQNCNSVLNCFSTVDTQNQIWSCEFCELQNKVDLEPEELPGKDTHIIDYILESPAQVLEQKKTQEGEEAIVFCIDISGSMCVTSEVSGKLKFKFDKTAEINRQLMQFQEEFGMQYQFLPNERQDITYVSRLQCVQAAIEQQVQELSQGAPKKKVGIVTFNNEVTIIGDGTGNPVVIAGDKLYRQEEVVKIVDKELQMLKKPIGETQQQLIDKLNRLQETGPTALGPALLASILLTRNHNLGSKVIICTDGLANVGLGALENQKEIEQSEKFYADLAKLAKEIGISVSVITIQGEEASIENLQKLSEETEGDVQRVEPSNLANNFANILSVPVVATHVKAVMRLHKGLTFREPGMKESSSIIEKDIGNVTSETEVTFQYGMKKEEELKAQQIHMSQIEKIPFQTIIYYTNLQGMRCMRVISELQEVTENRLEAEQDLKLEFIAVNAAKNAAQIAQEGDYRKAQSHAVAWKKYMKANATSEEQKANLDKYTNNMGMLNHVLQEQQYEEYENIGSSLNANERKRNRKDKLAHMMYHGKKANKEKCIIM